MIGTARRLADATGTMTDAYSLDAFGRSLGGWGSTENPYHYGAAWGYLRDYSGMQQLGARFYWPEVGRFLQQDPIRHGTNSYAYVANNPAIYVDPDGHNPVAIVGGVAGFAGGFVGAWIQCPHDWKGAIGSGLLGGAVGVATGFGGPAAGVAAKALWGIGVGALSGGGGDLLGQGLGYWRAGAPGGFHPDWGSFAGAAAGGALAGGLGGVVSGSWAAAAGKTAGFGVWGEVAKEVGSNIIGFGFGAFGGIFGSEWRGR